MSTKLITIDDHTGDEITTNPDASRASVTLSRNDHSLTWLNLNMTDDSWDGLIKLVRDFLPTVEPAGVESGLDDSDQPTAADEASAAADEARAQQTAALADRAQQAREARELADAEPAPATATDSLGRTRLVDPDHMTQAQRKERSRAIRAWYYSLDAKTLKALNLKTPNRSVTLGKLSPAVVAAYDASQV
jgi:hypothetical protein